MQLVEQAVYYGMIFLVQPVFFLERYETDAVPFLHEGTGPLVFIVNGDNPVQALTQQQLRAGVLALSRIYDPRVIRIAAVLAMLFSFSPKFAAIISSMPGGTIGGVSLVLYGMISAVGVRNVVENKVDFTKSRNVLVAALILVLSIGISYSSAGSLHFGAISLSGLAVGSIVGIVLNAVMPGKDYVYGEDKQGDESVNFIVQ